MQQCKTTEQRFKGHPTDLNLEKMLSSRHILRDGTAFWYFVAAKQAFAARPKQKEHKMGHQINDLRFSISADQNLDDKKNTF